jgi:hypothetical protein
MLPRLALTVGVAAALIGLTSTSAWALNTQTYNFIRNADLHQYCLDMKAEDPLEGARAQLWSCTHPVVGEQLFIAVPATLDGRTQYLNYYTIRNQRSGKCLTAHGGGWVQITQTSCYDYNVFQNFELRSTGEIVNQYSQQCFDTASDSRGAPVMEWYCNGNISQRWFL